MGPPIEVWKDLNHEDILITIVFDWFNQTMLRKMLDLLYSHSWTCWNIIDLG